jgi:hypothetical protein
VQVGRGNGGAADASTLDELVADYPADVRSISDDSPFFWHLTPFTEVASDMLSSATVEDREVAIGERVLLLLVGCGGALRSRVPAAAVRGDPA